MEQFDWIKRNRIQKRKSIFMFILYEAQNETKP